MKLISLCAAAAAVGLPRLACAAPAPQTADALIRAAQATAQKQHKNVLVLFHASW